MTMVTEENEPKMRSDGSAQERIAAIRNRLLANREQVVGKFTARLLERTPKPKT